MLNNLRKKIDELDNQIIDLLEKRFSITSKIKIYKTSKKDQKRENQILKKITSPHIKEIYLCIFKNSIKKNYKKD